MKSIPFDYKGKAYSLRLDINAMARAASFLDGEDTATTFIKFEANRLDIMRTRAIFAASLNVRLTLDRAGEMMQELGVDVTSKLVSQAMADALPLILKDAPTTAEKDGAEAGNAKD